MNGMKSRHNITEVTFQLTQILTGYEVIPANFGWHIHKGNTYCGVLQYQATKGWQGSALSYLSSRLKEQINKLSYVHSSITKVAA